MKQETSKMLNDVIPMWPGWQEGYASFTCSYHEKDGLIDYITNQQFHHRGKNFVEESGHMAFRASPWPCTRLLKLMSFGHLTPNN